MDRADHRIGSICHPHRTRGYELHGILNEEKPHRTLRRLCGVFALRIIGRGDFSSAELDF